MAEEMLHKEQAVYAVMRCDFWLPCECAAVHACERHFWPHRARLPRRQCRNWAVSGARYCGHCQALANNHAGEPWL